MLIRLLDPGNLVVPLYRMSRWWHQRGGRPCRWVAYAFYRLNLLVTGAHIVPGATIGARLTMPHPMGVCIGNAVIGDDAKIMGGVVLGLRTAYLHGSDELFPTIGDRVFLGAHSVVVGPVTIGDDCLIGPGTVVSSSIPQRSIVSARPPLVMRRDEPASASAPEDRPLDVEVR